MAHEILSVKLCQLDDRVERLHSRIHLSETADPRQLRQEILALERSSAEDQAVLRDKLQRSKLPMVSVLAQGYSRMEQIVQEVKVRLQAMAADSSDAQAPVEEKILLAEYALDFAHQAADQALLLSMAAIEAQLQQQEEGNAT